MHKVKAGFSLTESVVNILLVSMLFLAAIPMITTKVKYSQDWSDEDGQMWFETQPIGKGIYYNDNGTVGINVDNDFITESNSGYFQNKGITIGSYNATDDNTVIAYGDYNSALGSKTFNFDAGSNYIWDPEICTLGTISGGTQTLNEFAFNEGSPAASYSVGGSGDYSFRGDGDYSCENGGAYSYDASGTYSVTIGDAADAAGDHSASIGNSPSTCSVSGSDAVLIGGDYNDAAGGIIIGGHHTTSSGGIIAGAGSPYTWNSTSKTWNDPVISSIETMLVATDDMYKVVSLRRDVSNGDGYKTQGQNVLGGYSSYADGGSVLGGKLNNAGGDGIVLGGELNNAGSFSKAGTAYQNKALVAGGSWNYASGGKILGGQQNMIFGSSENNLILGNNNKIGDINSSLTYSNNVVMGDNVRVLGNNVVAIGHNSIVRSTSDAANPFKTVTFGDGININTTKDTLYLKYGWDSVQSNINGTSGLLERTVFSDRRLKKDIKKLEYGLDEILKLNPIVFNYNGHKGEIKEGFIAQEVKKIFPDVVGKGKKYYYIKYGALYKKVTMALVNAYKEIFTKIVSLQKENRQLNKKIAKLNKKLDKLEGRRYE